MTRQLTILASVVTLAAFALVGCDGSDQGNDAMRMQPAPPNPTTGPATLPATRPTVAAVPKIEPVATAAAPSWINIDDVPYEFPPAKLFLKRNGDAVKVKLLSKAPAGPDGEAESGRWKGQSFYFEMELDVPRPAGGTPGEGVSPDELARAEWLFHADSSDRADAPSSIVLARENGLLQPADVMITFDPIDDNLVQVTLTGTFGEFDASRPRQTGRLRQVRVVAILDAETLRR